jgi:hypothetical protein
MDGLGKIGFDRLSACVYGKVVCSNLSACVSSKVVQKQ